MVTTEIEIGGKKYEANVIVEGEKHLLIIKGLIAIKQLERLGKHLEKQGWNNLSILSNWNDVGIEISQSKNPLADIVPMPDEIYEKLAKVKHLLNPTIIRNLEIRRKFKKMRASKIKSSTAIETLEKEYPYLQYDSIRKIVNNNILKEN